MMGRTVFLRANLLLGATLFAAPARAQDEDGSAWLDDPNVTVISLGSRQDEDDELRTKIGLGLTLGGGALAGPGWPMFFVLRKPSVNRESIVKRRRRHGGVDAESSYAANDANDGALVGAGLRWSFRF